MTLKEYLEQDKPAEIKVGTINGGFGGFAFCGDPYNPTEKGDGEWNDDFFNREVYDAYLSIDPEFPDTIIYFIDGYERNHVYFRGEKASRGYESKLYLNSLDREVRKIIRNSLRPLERKSSTSWKGFPGKDEVHKRQYERSRKHAILTTNYDLGWWSDNMVSRVIKAENDIQLGIIQKTLREKDGKIEDNINI